MQTRFKSYWLSLALVIGLTVWLATGDIEQASEEIPEQKQEQGGNRVKVAFREVEAEKIDQEVTLQGQVEPYRRMTIQARLDSQITNLHFSLGDRVSKGDVIVTLDEESIPDQIAEAKAQVSLAESELKAALSLAKRGLLAETEQKSREANLAAAKSRLAGLLVQKSHAKVHVPFSGVIQQKFVESGEVVHVGSQLVDLLDDSKVKLVGEVTQHQVADLEKGMPVVATLLNGKVLKGRLSFIGNVANENTRTFRVEANLENPEYFRVVGATATLKIQVGEVLAHKLSPALLNLDNEGRLSVEHLDEDNRVLMTPVERVKASASALWIKGLPASTRVITLGKGFVSPGDQVEAQNEQDFNQERI